MIGLVAMGGTAAAAPARSPDFVVRHLAVAPLPAAVSIGVTTANAGHARAGASTTGLYLSADRTLGKADIRLRGIRVPALAPGHQSRRVVRIPLATLAADLRGLTETRVLACADDGHRIVEARTGNDCASSARIAVPQVAFTPPDLQPPSAPTLSVSSAGTGEIDLVWSSATDNVAVTAYELLRCRGTGCSDFTVVAQLPASAASFADVGLSPSTSFGYEVRALDAAGNRSPASNVATAATAAPKDTQAPSAPSGLSSSGQTSSAITVSWSAASDNVGVAGYRVYENGGRVGSSVTTSYTFASLSCGSSYTFGVSATDAAGNVSSTATIDARTTACPDTTPPSAPGGLSTAGVGETGLTLTWSASSDDTGVTGYRVLVGGVQVGTSLATSYVIGGLSCGTSYTFAVAAVDAAGNVSAASSFLGRTAACPDTSPPSAPTDLVSTDVAATGLTVSWSASTDDVGVTGYRVSLDGAPVGTSVSTSYVFDGLACGSSHLVGVVAVDAAANASSAASAMVRTADCPDTRPPSAPTALSSSGITSTRVTLSWSASTDDVAVSGYRLFRDGAQVGSTSGTSFDFSGLSCGTAYTLGVAAVDAAANASAAATIDARTADCPVTEAPSAPQQLAASVATATEIDLSWVAAADDGAIARYDVFRCEGSNCSSYLPVGRSTTTSYADTEVSASTAYSYEVRAVDSDGNAGDMSNGASVSTPAGSLSVSANGRYLVDQSGRPFLMAGDSPQAAIGDLTPADAETYFADRAAHGFNTVWINLLCDDYTGCNADGTTWDGIAPFTIAGDFSTPNEAYFSRADRILRLAAQHGLTVLLDPAETGGWLSTITANGVDEDRAFGRFLGVRYRDFPNIVWMSGNDYQHWNPVDDAYVTAVARGIADTDSNHLQTVELNYETSGSLDDPAWAPIIKLNASYTYFPAYLQVQGDYDRSSFLPTFLVEGTYEFEQNTGPYGNPLVLRRQEYWTALSGATGQVYGNHYTWQFLCAQRDASGNCSGSGWKDELDTPGSTQFEHLTDLFEPRAWYDLVPDESHALVTAGYGTWGGTDYVTAARTPDGSLAVAYTPTGSTMTVDLGELSGPVTARWYDPASGTFTAIGAGPLANSGSEQFTPPGANSDGDPDWVLLLESH